MPRAQGHVLVTGAAGYLGAHVALALQAVVAALNGLDAHEPPLVANVSTGVGVRLDAVLEAFVERSGHRLVLEPIPLAPGVADNLVGDATRMRRWTDWSPKASDLDSIVSTALAFEAHRR